MSGAPSPLGASEQDAAALGALRLARTDAGRAEIQRKLLPLSRPARNLLLIIDAGRSAGDWLALVQGAGPADLAALIDAGLVAAEGPAPAPAAPARTDLAQALQAKSYEVLYDRITAQARPRLGLLKGYRVILEVERCGGPDALRALAQRFVAQVQSVHGDAAAADLVRLLLAPD